MTSNILDARESIAKAKDISQKLDELNELMNKRKHIVSNARSKLELVSILSHDLRTPLNSIIGFSELLLEGMNGSLNASQSDFIKNIHESALELLESVKISIEIHGHHFTDK